MHEDGVAPEQISCKCVCVCARVCVGVEYDIRDSRGVQRGMRHNDLEIRDRHRGISKYGNVLQRASYWRVQTVADACLLP